ncbi:Panacea domain-containing protein [Bacteroides graminisolvens]
MTSNKFPFNKEKALNAVLYIAKKLKRSDFHKIFKILYFSDRQHLAEYGSPITGDSYIAMDAGPVPSKVYDIFKIVRGDSYMADTEKFGELFAIEDWMYIKAKQDANLRKLSPNEKDIIDNCIREYGNMTYDEIKEKSHDIAWRSTAKDYEIKLDDIAREAGLDNDDLEYVNELKNLENVFC